MTKAGRARFNKGRVGHDVRLQIRKLSGAGASLCRLAAGLPGAEGTARFEARGPVSPEQQGCCAGGPGRGRVELDLLRNHLDVAARALLSANTAAFAVGVVELVVLAWA